MDKWKEASSAGAHISTSVASLLTSTSMPQGNVDPVILFAEPDAIEAAVRDVLQKAGPKGHILNLGHGVVVGALSCSMCIVSLAQKQAPMFQLSVMISAKTSCLHSRQGLTHSRSRSRMNGDTNSARAVFANACAGTPEESVAHMFQLSKDIRL